MDIIVLLRIAITATFFMIAAGGPYAIWLLRRFIKHYVIAHGELEARVAALERHEKGAL
jgi:hypothetical protein